MRRNGWKCGALWPVLLCGLLCTLPSGCEKQPAAPSEETNVNSGAESGQVSEQLPPPEAVVLLYDDYLTAEGEQGGIGYTYTYCFGRDGTVFNAIATIRFPEETAAAQAYRKLRKSEYPNLLLNGSTLTFSFPRKECPYYGISYRALPALLEETIYTVTDAHLPDEPPA